MLREHAHPFILSSDLPANLPALSLPTGTAASTVSPNMPLHSHHDLGPVMSGYGTPLT